MLLVPLAVLAFLVLVDRFRGFEAWLVGAVPVSGAQPVGDATLLVAGPGTKQPFAVNISRSCSALSIVVGTAVVACCFLRSGVVRRFVAAAAAAAVAVGLNAARASGIVVVGRHEGTDGMVMVHDWLGTSMTVASACLALVVLLWIGTDRRPPSGLDALATPAAD